MNAKCLACSAGKTIEAYCAENQDATGCEARGNLLNQKSIGILFYCYNSARQLSISFNVYLIYKLMVLAATP